MQDAAAVIDFEAFRRRRLAAQQPAAAPAAQASASPSWWAAVWVVWLPVWPMR
jgi:hypothetical protein